MKTAFISGHLDLTEKEFQEHYVPKIDLAIEENHHFIMGDAKGADSMAMNYLYQKSLSERVTVYHMFTSPRNYVEGAWKRGGYKTDSERDTAMTAFSNYDIAWVRIGREKSGTQKNLDRRNNNGRV